MRIPPSIQWLLLGLAALAASVYLAHNREVLTSFRNLTPAMVVLLFGFILISFLALAYQFNIMMKLFGVRLSTNEWFGLTICNTMYNYFLPSVGGMWLRALYLKKRYGFEYSRYLNVVLGSFLLMFSVSSFLGLLAVGLDSLISGGHQWGYFSILLLPALLVALTWTLVLLVHRSSFRTSWANINVFLDHFREGISSFFGNTDLMRRFFLSDACFIVLSGLSYWACLRGLGADNVTILSPIGVMALTSYSKVLSVTPGNLGISEAIMGLSCSYLGVSFDVALLAALTNRAASMIVTFGLGILYSKILIGGLSSKGVRVAIPKE